MSRVYEGTYGARLLTNAEFTAFGAGGFRPGRLFRIAVTGAALAAGQGLSIELAEGSILHLPQLPLGQVQVAGEAAICQAILVNDGATPPKTTAFGTSTLEIGYVKADYGLRTDQA